MEIISLNVISFVAQTGELTMIVENLSL